MDNGTMFWRSSSVTKWFVTDKDLHGGNVLLLFITATWTLSKSSSEERADIRKYIPLNVIYTNTGRKHFHKERQKALLSGRLTFWVLPFWPSSVSSRPFLVFFFPFVSCVLPQSQTSGVTLQQEFPSHDNQEINSAVHVCSEGGRKEEIRGPRLIGDGCTVAGGHTSFLYSSLTTASLSLACLWFGSSTSASL